MSARARLTALLLVILVSASSGADRSVRTSGELAAAINEAQAGDRIVLAPGEYVLSASITVGPLTVEAADVERKPVVKPGEGAFILDAGNVEGTVLVRHLVFDGEGKEVPALQTVGARLEVEGCEFRDFAGKTMLSSGRIKESTRKLRGIGVSGCTFRKNPKGGAISSVGPALVEDCTFENVARGIGFQDFSGPEANLYRRYKVIIRRNHFYRTEGTTYPCHVMTVRTTEPEIYENLIHDITPHNTNALEIGSNMLDQNVVPTAAEIYRNVIVDQWKAADSGWLHEGIEYGEYRPSHGRIYENVIVCRGKGGVRPSYYNKGDHNEWFNNVLYCTPASEGQFFHCYGLQCRYYNNIQVGARASMLNQKTVDVWISKQWLGKTATSEDHSLDHCCFWRVRENSFLKGEGYFEADPKFVDPDGTDFHLRFDSPCINKGTGSRDGLTPTDLGAFEYPIQVSGFKVDENGVATWGWTNDFQKVSRVVRIRWHGARLPEVPDGEGDTTVAEVPAAVTKAPTGKRSGYFAAFVQDVKGRWSGPTPDGVHRFAVGVPAK